MYIKFKVSVLHFGKEVSNMEIVKNSTAEFILRAGEPIETEKLYSMLGLDNVDFPDKYDVEFNVLVQKRKHKNKRINKKWAKMYGYEIVNQKSKGWCILSRSDGSIEFLK